MRLPKTAHTDRPWRIHEITPDFSVEDVWALPTPGGPDELDRLVRVFGRDIAGNGNSPISSPVPRALFAARWKLGEWFGWDRPGDGLDGRVASLRDRLPTDLRDGPRGPDSKTLPVKSLYRTHDEWAAEIANRTVHGVMHVGWVDDPDAAGGHRGQLTVLVKPNGTWGKVYLAGIKPFRYLGVYPAMLRTIGRGWQATA